MGDVARRHLRMAERRRGAPDHVVPVGGTLRAGHGGADRRVEAVGADQHVGVHFAAVAAEHGDAFAVGVAQVAGGAHAQFDAAVAGLFQQRLLQARAVDRQARLAELTGQAAEVDGADRSPAPGEEPQRVEGLGAGKVRAHADPLQGGQRVGHQRQRRADRAQLPGPLVEFDLEAGGFQAGGRGEPADAGAGDDDLQGMSAHGRVRSLEVEGSSNAAISAATVST